MPAGATLQRRLERFEVVLSEGDSVEVEGVLRREPLPSGLGGGYRERTNCWAMAPGPDGHVRVLGVGASAPVSETVLRGVPTKRETRSAGVLSKIEPALVATAVVSAVLLALAYALQ